MSRSETYNNWIQAGYELFAHEGPDGIHVEKLARILNLNKSGFYHYFGDIETFVDRLIKHHEELIGNFLNDIPVCKQIDPDFLNVMLKHKLTIMAHVQVVRNEKNSLFTGVFKKQDIKAWNFFKEIWGNHINIESNPELAFKLYSIVRDMFYTRISWENFNFDYLLGLSDDICNIVLKTLTEKERLENRKCKE